MYTKSPARIFLRSGSDIYYMTLKNPLTGKIIKRSTKTSDWDEAINIQRKEQAKLDGLVSTARLCDILALYADPATNPRKKQSELDGRTYGEAHALGVATKARQMIALFSVQAPKIYHMDMVDIKIVHIKTLKEILVNEYGHRRKTQQMFSSLKAMFSQAHEDGIVHTSPCYRIGNINYDADEREALPLEAIKLILSERDSMDRKMWCFAAIAISTGMRRGEIMALNSKQLIDGGRVLRVDRAIKDATGKVGLPKGNVSRIIPLSKFTQSVFAELTPDIQGNFFPELTWNTFSESFAKRVRGYMRMRHPDFDEVWEGMTCHVFRHTLFSLLICNGATQLLAEEYLSWSHQNLKAMPANYLHIYASSLNPIAELIDEILIGEQKTARIKA